MADAIQFNVDAALQKLGDLVQQHGAQVVNTAASVERVSALTTLLHSGVFVVIGACLGWTAFRLGRWAFRQADIDETMPAWFGAVVSGAASAMLLLGAIMRFTDPWSWVALTDPRLALAHDIMQRVAGIG